MNLKALSLADLESFDGRAPSGKTERRFLCLNCGSDKPRDAAHRSLALNVPTGAYFCHRCGLKGVIKDNWEEKPTKTRKARTSAALARAFTVTRTPEAAKEIKNDSRAILSQIAREAIPIWGTNGQRYIEGRGIPAEVAVESGVLYTRNFYGREAIIFPMRDAEDNLIAYNGRFIDGKESEGKLKTQSAGKKSLGLFITPGAFGADCVAVCEGVFDALSLHCCGLPAVAIVGTSSPAHLPDELAFRCVLIATDNDAAGDAAADKLTEALRAFGSRVARFKPEEVKDWGEALQDYGAGFIRSAAARKIADAFTIDTPPDILEKLNGFIAAGVVFDVSINSIKAKGKTDNLSRADREFIQANSAAVLCTLQQSLLTKNFFNYSLELLADFGNEIEERDALITGDDDPTPETYSEAVRDITKKWFDRLLSEV